CWLASIGKATFDGVGPLLVGGAEVGPSLLRALSVVQAVSAATSSIGVSSAARTKDAFAGGDVKL
ncbi:hypothetical protein ABZX92_43260, partial [Lentzea sp. NPDC006480]